MATPHKAAAAALPASRSHCLLLRAEHGARPLEGRPPGTAGEKGGQAQPEELSCAGPLSLLFRRGDVDGRHSAGAGAESWGKNS